MQVKYRYNKNHKMGLPASEVGKTLSKIISEAAVGSGSLQLSSMWHMVL